MKEKSNNLVLFNVWGTKKSVVYKYVGYGNGYGTNPTRLFSLGNLQKLLDKNPNAVEILKDKLKSFTRNDDMEVVKSALLQSLETENILKTSRIFGVDLIYKFLNKHEFKNLFDNTKQLNSYEIFSFLVSKRIIDPSSIFNSFNEKDEYLNDIKTSKNAFYRTLDVVYKNSDKLLEHLRLMVEKELKEKTNEIYYDTSTIYFETFTRNGIKHPGYSKDGKFKEDQIVIALACDKYGIPYHFKLFKGNTIDSKTLIPFFIEIERKYGARNITVVTDRGMSTAANIRFLEKKGYKFIISYRAKTGGNEFKDYITDEKDYIQIDSEYKYKSFSFVSTYKKKRADLNHLRLKFITHSNKRAKKDKEERQILIDNFNKKRNKDGTVDSNKMLGSKKCKFFKEISKLKFELDTEKVQEDAKLDGYNVYETNLFDLEPKEIIQKYANQWKIENNFRILKSFLNIRPIFLRVDDHIYSHTLICFTSLVVLKLLIHKINKTMIDNGVLDEKLTEEKFIKLLNKVRERLDLNSKTKEILKREREDSQSFNNSWYYFDIYSKIVNK